MFLKVTAVDRDHACQVAKELCACKRMSFDGVQYQRRDGSWEKLTWSEIYASVS